MSKRGPHNPAITWTPHVQISFGGTIGVSNPEVWTCGFKWNLVDPLSEPTPDQLQACLGTLSTDIAAWFGGSGTNQSFIGIDAALTYVKLNMVEATGLQRAGDTIRTDLTTPVNGPQNVGVPWHQTYAVTLRTALHRGRSHSGRFYPPLVAVQPDIGSPYCSLVAANGMASAAATLVTSINNDLGSHAGMLGHIAVMSPGNTAKGTTPTHQNVTGVVVDRVADVQHRRTDRVARNETSVITIP
jgi:hypothetical protein